MRSLSTFRLSPKYRRFIGLDLDTTQPPGAFCASRLHSSESLDGAGPSQAFLATNLSNWLTASRTEWRPYGLKFHNLRWTNVHTPSAGVGGSTTWRSRPASERIGRFVDDDDTDPAGADSFKAAHAGPCRLPPA